MRPQVLVILGTEGHRQLPGSDRVALGLALSELQGTVTACARATDPHALHYAAAAGVDRFLKPEALEDCAFDVALLGRGGCGDAGDLLPAMLAERSGAALAYEVVDVRRKAQGLEVTRDLGRGARDVLLVRGPVVLVVADSARRRAGYISRRRLLAAATTHAVASAPSSESLGIPWQRTIPRVRLGNHPSKVQGSATTRRNELFGIAASRGKGSEDSRVVTGSAETCARHLLRYLVHHDFITLDIDEATEPVMEAPAEAGQRGARSVRPGRRGGTRRGPYRLTEQGKEP